jgi:hypothetical protein
MNNNLINRLVRNKRLLLTLPLILATTLFLTSQAIPSAHAAAFNGIGLVCVVFPSTSTTCPTSSPTYGPVTKGTNITVGIRILNSTAMGGFDIYVRSDSTVLNPRTAALGSLILTPSLTSICVNGSSAPPAGTGSCTIGTANGVGVVEVTTIEASGANECGGISPCSGLAFTITYTVVSAVASTQLTYPTALGCAASSVLSPPNVCVEVADSVGTVLRENVQTPAATITQAVAAKDPTTTGVSCTSPVVVGVATSCTATVTDTAATGATNVLN